MNGDVGVQCLMDDRDKISKMREEVDDCLAILHDAGEVENACRTIGFFEPCLELGICFYGFIVVVIALYEVAEERVLGFVDDGCVFVEGEGLEIAATRGFRETACLEISAEVVCLDRAGSVPVKAVCVKRCNAAVPWEELFDIGTWRVKTHCR